MVAFDVYTREGMTPAMFAVYLQHTEHTHTHKNWMKEWAPRGALPILSSLRSKLHLKIHGSFVKVPWTSGPMLWRVLPWSTSAPLLIRWGICGYRNLCSPQWTELPVLDLRSDQGTTVCSVVSGVWTEGLGCVVGPGLGSKGSRLHTGTGNYLPVPPCLSSTLWEIQKSWSQTWPCGSLWKCICQGQRIEHFI